MFEIRTIRKLKNASQSSSLTASYFFLFAISTDLMDNHDQSIKQIHNGHKDIAIEPTNAMSVLLHGRLKTYDIFYWLPHHSNTLVCPQDCNPEPQASRQHQSAAFWR